MSLTFKLLSLAIRTAAKPIGNYIKRQAKEHNGFRQFAVNQAQRVHRIDMRMRLGILHDPDAQQRMHERELKAAEDKKRKEETPTVRTEEEQRKHDEQKAKEAANPGEGKKTEEKPLKIKIRPLSEARAIELGANFFSEAFIFAVAAGLLIWDSWRSRKKEHQRRDDVAERLEQLESEVGGLRARLDPDLDTLHDLSERIKEAKRRKQSGWRGLLGWSRAEEDVTPRDENSESSAAVQSKEEAVRASKLDATSDAKKNETARAIASNDVAASKAAKTAAKKVDGAPGIEHKQTGAEKAREAEDQAGTRPNVVAASNKSR